MASDYNFASKISIIAQKHRALYTANSIFWNTRFVAYFLTMLFTISGNASIAAEIDYSAYANNKIYIEVTPDIFVLVRKVHAIDAAAASESSQIERENGISAEVIAQNAANAFSASLGHPH